MGVSGSGKSTIGEKLAQKLTWTYFEGDDYHSVSNKEKMAAGIPLTDQDREPWLQALKTLILEKKEKIIIGCSALKQAYRDILLINSSVKIVYLKCNPTILKKRLLNRKDHFFKATLLKSQLKTLQEPKNAVSVDGNASVNEITKSICTQLKIDGLT